MNYMIGARSFPNDQAKRSLKQRPTDMYTYIYTIKDRVKSPLQMLGNWTLRGKHVIFELGE